MKCGIFHLDFLQPKCDILKPFKVDRTTVFIQATTSGATSCTYSSILGSDRVEIMQNVFNGKQTGVIVDYFALYMDQRQVGSMEFQKIIGDEKNLPSCFLNKFSQSSQ